MSDYSNTFGGAAHDTAEDVIYGADFDTQFDAVSTMSATKANKKTPATTNSLATLDSGGDLGDSLETVATMKSYAKRGAIYLDAATTSSTISFSGTTISRTAGTIDLSVFKKGDVITITGTTLNNTSYTLASDASASSITTTASTTAESGQVPVFTTEGVVEVLDEDDMATDSASSVPSQQSVKAYVDTEVATIKQWTFIETLDCSSGFTATTSGDYSGCTAIRCCIEDMGGDSFGADGYIELSSGGFSGTGATGGCSDYTNPSTKLWASGKAYWFVDVNQFALSGLLEIQQADNNQQWHVISNVLRHGTSVAHENRAIGIITTAGAIDALRFGCGGVSGFYGTTKAVHIWAFK